MLSLPDSTGTGQVSHSLPQVDDRMLLEKIDNTVREYNYLLTSQLEVQRKYFEDKIEARLAHLRADPVIGDLD